MKTFNVLCVCVLKKNDKIKFNFYAWILITLKENYSTIVRYQSSTYFIINKYFVFTTKHTCRGRAFFYQLYFQHKRDKRTRERKKYFITCTLSSDVDNHVIELTLFITFVQLPRYMWLFISYIYSFYSIYIKIEQTYDVVLRREITCVECVRNNCTRSVVYILLLLDRKDERIRTWLFTWITTHTHTQPHHHMTNDERKNLARTQ